MRTFGVNCHDLEYGGGSPTILRIDTGVGLAAGDCVQFAWPMGFFDTEVQFDVYDTAQLEVYRATSAGRSSSCCCR